MYEGWFSLGGAEIANNQRYAAYAAELGLPVPLTACSTLPVVLADDPYGTAGVAGAPWADATAPESAGFAGLFVTSITGLDSATAVRDVAPVAVGDGGVPTITRSGPRTMLVSGFLAATSGNALSYGLAWLASVLRDDCNDGCDGATMCLLAECPTCEDDPNGCWEELTRTVHDVVCVAGPTVIEKTVVSGCSGTGVGARVEFTLVAAAPFIFRAPAVIAGSLAFTPPEESEDCPITWRPVGAGRGDCPPRVEVCEPAVSCLIDPAHPLPVLTALRAPSAAACVTRLTEAWALATAPAGTVPHHLDSVPVVTVNTGSAAMRRLTLRFHANPLLADVDDPAQLDPCTAVAELNVTYLPRDAVLVVDGRLGRAWVVCPGGGKQDAGAVLFGPGGGPFRWPVLSCGSRLTVAALVDGAHYDTGARVGVSLAARTDVA